MALFTGPKTKRRLILIQAVVQAVTLYPGPYVYIRKLHSGDAGPEAQRLRLRSNRTVMLKALSKHQKGDRLAKVIRRKADETAAVGPTCTRLNIWDH